MCICVCVVCVCVVCVWLGTGTLVPGQPAVLIDLFRAPEAYST